MPTESVAIAVQNSKASEEVVKGVAAGITEGLAADQTLQFELHLCHITVTFEKDEQALVRKASRFVEKRFQPHLAALPASSCTWHVHVVKYQRPYLDMGRDEDGLIAYSLCRKAARMGCSELVLKGGGPQSPWLCLFTGSSISHLCSQWSTIPVRLWSRRRGWQLQQPQGIVPPGHSWLTWRRSLTPSAVPVIDGHLVHNPDGAVHAVWLDTSMDGSRLAF